MNKEGIAFDMEKKEEFPGFIDELESSLNQVQKIQKVELKKENVKDFLNGL
ncbi:hypothetical protein [Algoriphagus sp. Y33]|uniref:hypothetical protein n=1 Tax=Algoriphagus sp. Y33 TaxID=2772483 RepID=UPI001785B5AE|nr:hypothetical protein [Algoriphagus sp. Y33]